jgi:hypothetical protein
LTGVGVEDLRSDGRFCVSERLFLNDGDEGSLVRAGQVAAEAFRVVAGAAGDEALVDGPARLVIGEGANRDVRYQGHGAVVQFATDLGIALGHGASIQRRLRRRASVGQVGLEKCNPSVALRLGGVRFGSGKIFQLPDLV